jgi:acetylornithine aminotransferase
MRHLIWLPGHEVLLPEIVRAEGCHLYGSDGKRYVDLESGVWCASVGHGNPRILRALSAQAKRIGHTGFGYSARIVDESAEEILSLLGFDGGKCVFLCSGSEAVEYGVRVAQMLLERPLLMTMTDSYCGAYGSASIKSEDEWFTFDWMSCAGCPESKACHDGCEHWASIPFEQIGGFLLEPGSSSGLVRFPPEKLISSIVGTVRDNNGLYLVNEITTGIGRTGKWFGHQHYGISPDIIAMGKGIGNGYPVSVTAFAPHITARLGNKPVNYAQSHQNDPLGAAVAREVVRTIRDEGLIAKSVATARTFMSGLEDLTKRTDRIRQVRGRGFMVAIELEDQPGFAFTIRTHRELVRRGFVLGRRPGTSVLRLDPPLTIGPEDLQAFLSALEQVLQEGAS